MSDEKRENNGSENSDVEDVDSGAEDAAAVTIPKKRGRPAKGGVKVEKVPSGRGRGRPAKAAAAADGSDSDAAVENGKKAVAGSRGRPPKAKGRGRPKAAVKRVAEEGNSSPTKVQAAAGGKRGRPRKNVQMSDDEGN